MFVPYKGGSVYVEDWTPEVVRSDVPVLLLHDSIGSVGTWRQYPATLAERLGRRVIAYDRLGFGLSSPLSELPPNSFIADEAEAIRHLLGSLDIQKAVLYGYSVGGAMALCAAATLKEPIAVISESAQAFVEDRTLAGVEAARLLFANRERRDKLRRWHEDKTDWILRAWFDVWSSPSYADWSLAPILPEVKCPVLTMHGDLDDYGSVAFPKMIAERSGGESTMLILENCGHNPHREQPEVVLGAIGEFLKYHQV